MKKYAFLFLSVFLLLVLVTPVSATLKIGVLPDADSIPLLVANEEGLFSATGKDIQIVRFDNPVERDSALQAGAIDGAISDVLAAAFANDKRDMVKITSLTNGRYVLLSGKNSGITSYQGLKGVQIAISSNTIIEYIAEKLMESQGFKGSDIAEIAIPKIPVRLQMLEAGKIKAACLPEPLASQLLLHGAHKIGVSTDLGEAPGVILFSDKAIAEKSSEIKAFYQAYAKAAKMINKNPDNFRELLITKGGFPAEIKDSFVFPKYDQPRLPAEDTVQQVVNWLSQKGLIKRDYSYQDLVTDQFVK